MFLSERVMPGRDGRRVEEKQLDGDPNGMAEETR